MSFGKYNLTAEVRRGLGKKVLELGGNAVLGYNAHVDIEGQAGIVVRYGTIEAMPNNP